MRKRPSRNHLPYHPRSKRSAIWLALNDEEFTKLVAQSNHMGDVLNAFGLENVGGNHETARTRINLLELSTAHFDSSKRDFGASRRPLLDVLVKDNKKISTSNLKNRMLRAKIISELCAICGALPEWLGKKLVLVLDHIDGNRHNNCLDNLRLLCPNCNSQQDTFAGRNRKRKVLPVAL